MNEQQFIDGAFKAGLNPQQVSQAVQVYRQKNPPKSVGGFIGNVGKSALSNVGAIGSAILHPIDTVGNVAKTSIGALQLLRPGEQGYEPYARNVGNFYKQRYGGLSNIGNTLYNDPVGAALDASVVLGGAGAVTKGVGEAAKIGELGKIGEGLSTASRMVDPFQLAGRGVSETVGRTVPKASQTLLKRSENILTQGMGNPKALEKVKGVSPVTMNELFKKYNLYDRTPETFAEAANQAGQTTKNLVAQAGAMGTKVDVPTIIKRFNDEIAKFHSQAQTSDKAAAVEAELVRRREMFLNSIQNPNVSTPLAVNVSDVGKIKSQFQSDIPQSSFGMPTQEVGKNQGITRAYKTLLGGMEDVAPGIKQAGREQSALIKLQEMAKAAEARGSVRRGINFTKLGGAGLGGLIAGFPGAIAGYVGESLLNTPKVLAGQSKIVENMGNFLQKASLPKSFGSTLNTTYNLGKVGRVTNNQKILEQSAQPKYQEQMPIESTLTNSTPFVTPKPYAPAMTKQIKFNLPKNPFKNQSNFGKSFKLKPMN